MWLCLDAELLPFAVLVDASTEPRDRSIDAGAEVSVFLRNTAVGRCRGTGAVLGSTVYRTPR